MLYEQALAERMKNRLFKDFKDTKSHDFKRKIVGVPEKNLTVV